ncbi:hypothetical protein OAM77_00715 [Alphaproteobacteria bacterium]|nr:hypothetical protein [Alphaproteobacteria bacterium]
MSEEEKYKRIAQITTNEGWVELYNDVFGEEADFSGEFWGAFPVELIIDAILDNKPIRQTKLPPNVVA